MIFVRQSVVNLSSVAPRSSALITKYSKSGQRSLQLSRSPNLWGTLSGLSHLNQRKFSGVMSAAPKELSPADAARLVENEKYTYLDVRTPEEFAAGHVPGAVNIPLMLRGPAGMSPNSDFISQVKETFPKGDEAIVVGCQAGNRSARALQLLVQDGFSELAHNSTGWSGWVAAGLPKTT